MRTILLFLVLLLPVTVSAAMLEAEVTPTESGARVTILLSATTTSVNAIEGTLILPEGATASKLYIGGSIIQSFIEAPRVDRNGIRFAGIIPGGFTGSAVPGAGLSGSASLFSFEMTGTGALTLTDGAVYLNDGAGTRIKDAGGVLEAHLVLDGVPASDDRTPPEFVEAVPLEEKAIAEGRYSLVLSSYDGGSGIDHFEVQEGDGAWSTSSEVYEVEDTWGFDSIAVRAYDRAGNFVETKVEGRNAPYLKLGYALGGLVALLLLLVLVVYLRKPRA